ncbi:glutamine synthetase [Pseudomonas petrae]|uniref:Glutamine synthetase n=1 Tax=Pseudomonas petrae TaxID=2912190 RepID=A0ABS9HZ78_9PSED|nr:glutamine synthetase [Pseudomonas petrae]MCF7531621.1 glutamine synthetase [Pseudomonas petrae]MCF7537184.1 glutamine synthetase [Pseudomonas petrae]MCF7540860.1 glutamine synthetase [Pseudomonas petrae]MCF7556356.1 glutamine synthetase [Pseudomonas petrae]
MTRLFWLLAGCSLVLSTQVFALPPSPGLDKALCTRTATLLACIDADNNTYSVAVAGKTMFVRGFENVGKRRWAQTNSRYGPLTFFTGLASDGETWVGYTQKVGWTTITRVSSSSGSRTKITCDRVMGCR